ncbi:universal stress protein [Haloplanus aerogenes]|uniref:Nucleotide-binding universal stress UspA family protein n=1 Tax=Haloplanus aerogenes TaxID=660522 RepID=A0A3M0CWY5_9EURY|nr:universal stress protein [Haloplanus aerogenes]AZH25100.1 universal stress protein [Haloplanus aerogenes]RMB13678.1 nucleotide-binding universal stress UspA family protein [Haloplanus aerogenes]
MKVLVPVDGSKCSMRALGFGADFAKRFDATLDVVHFTDSPGSDTERLKGKVEEVLEAEGLQTETEVIGDVRLDNLKASDQVGKDILELVEDRDYDHVVMGHHGTGRIGKFLLGSAANTVSKSGKVPTTIVP